MKCECSNVPESPEWHGGETKQCPREAEEYENIVCSPALCNPCLFGCYE